MKYTYYINLIIWLNVVLLAVSCTEDTISNIHVDNHSTVTLLLPKVEEVSIKTRAISDESTIDDLLFITFQNGKAKCQSFSTPSISGGKISVTLTDFSVGSGETLYVCSNTGLTSITATNADELAEELTYTNVETGMVMWGASIVSETTPISIQLERVFAKASVECSAAGYTIESWKVCNVPSKGYMSSSQAGYPNLTTFGETITPTGNDAYFIPRTDNSSSSDAKTYILVKLAGQGWYKLDFYNGTTSLDISKSVPLLDIKRNTHYAFRITDIKNGGYTTEDEAASNDGSNVIYDMEITTGHGVSNGQYSLILDQENITLRPAWGDGVNTMEAIHISALLPNSESSISTYNVRMFNPSKQIHIRDQKGNDTDYLDLMETGTKLTSANSLRTITLSFTGADVYDSYLEVQLGNVIKQIPISILTSNSYLVDFGSLPGVTLYIPVIQANRDGIERITRNDNLETFILWSDNPDVTKDNLGLYYDPDRKWLVMNNSITFQGNVVVGISLNGVIKWSWHIWSMNSDVLRFDDQMKVYTFKDDCMDSFNGYTFMDRNLGACTLEKDGRNSDWGLLYQFGRKDPFPGAENSNYPIELQRIYCNGSPFTMKDNHPTLGTPCVVDGTSADNLEYSIQNPLQFIKGVASISDDGSVSSIDWRMNNYQLVDNEMWITSYGEKAAYNPCPIGWTLPNGGMIGPWYGLHISQATIDATGLTFDKAGYIPFQPNLNTNGQVVFDGSLIITYNRGVIMSWGTTNSTKIGCTRFRNNEIEISGERLRADGIPVRCIREK